MVSGSGVDLSSLSAPGFGFGVVGLGGSASGYSQSVVSVDDPPVQFPQTDSGFIRDDQCWLMLFGSFLRHI